MATSPDTLPSSSLGRTDSEMPRVSNRVWGAGLSAVVASLFALSFLGAQGVAASSPPVAAAAAGPEPTELQIGAV